MDARRKPIESVSRAEESLLSNRGAHQAEKNHGGPWFRDGSPSESQPSGAVGMLTPDESATAGAPLLDVGTTKQTNQKSSSDLRVVKARSCMKSQRECRGLKVRFGSSLLPDLFTCNKPKIPRSRVSTPAD